MVVLKLMKRLYKIIRLMKGILLRPWLRHIVIPVPDFICIKGDWFVREIVLVTKDLLQLLVCMELWPNFI